jgi:hypothetical protein
MSENKERARDIIYALVCLEIAEQNDGLDLCGLPRRDPKNWIEWLQQNADLISDAAYLRYKMEKAIEYADLMETERAVNKRLNQSPA